jgi:hypothetical protein
MSRPPELGADKKPTAARFLEFSLFTRELVGKEAERKQ